MSENRERILKLQEKMQELNIDMYLVPTADFHQSEYVGDYFKARKWLSGFSGSAGTLLVTDEQAYYGQTEDILFRQRKNLKIPELL